MRKRTGMSLIELLIVVLILGVLSTIALPRITTSAQTAKQNACASNIGIMNTQIEMYKLDNDSYPAALTDVTGDTTYFPDGAPSCPLVGSYTMSGTTYRVSCDH